MRAKLFKRPLGGQDERSQKRFALLTERLPTLREANSTDSAMVFNTTNMWFTSELPPEGEGEGEVEGVYSMTTYVVAGIVSVSVVALWLACSYYGKQQERRRLRKTREIAMRLQGLRTPSTCSECPALPDVLPRTEETQTTQV